MNKTNFTSIILFVTFIMSNALHAQSTLYNPNVIAEIEIFFGVANWDYQMDTSMAGAEGYIIADSVRINGIAYDSVGVKYKGNSSYNANNQKNPVHIKLDYVHDNAHFEHYTDLKLGNGYSDPSFIREFLSYQILEQYMDSPQCYFSNVSINGQLRGLYSNVQSIDERFNGDHYYSADGSFFKCNPQGGAGPGSTASPNLAWINSDSSSYYTSYELQSDYGWTDIVRMIDTLNNFTSAFENNMDIDRAIWMLAFNVALVNLDSYSGQFKQNYYLYKDLNQRFVPTVWDLNMSFGGFPGGQTPGSNQANLSVTYNSTDGAHPLIVKLLANPTYKKMYIAHMKTIMDENFSNGNYLDSANVVMANLGNAVNADPYKFFTYAQFLSSLTSNTTGTGGGPGGGSTIPGIQVLMDARNTYLQNTSEFQQQAPSLTNPNTGSLPINYGDMIHFHVEASNETEVWVGYRLNKTKRFIKLQMFDDGMHDDGSANDGVYGALATANGTYVQYYFYAQNGNAGTFLPARAEHEFFEVLFASSSANTGEIVINEVLTKNNFQVDEYGESNDWIELYNNSDQIKSLNGLYLTDDSANPMQWAFPINTMMAPHSYLMIWADDDQWQNVLHTNFNLSSLGGTLQITDGSQKIPQWNR
jgi:spore coat protein CotH